MEEKKIPRTVSIKLRYGDFTTTTAQTTPSSAIYSSSDVYRIASELLQSRYKGQGIRLIGVGLQGIYSGENVEQGEFFREREQKERELEKTILELGRNGRKVVRLRHLEKD